MNIWTFFFRGLALTIFITLTSGIYTLSLVKSDFDIMVTESLRVIRDTTHSAIKVWALENEHHIKVLAKDPYIISLTEELLATKHSPKALLTNSAQKKLRNYLKPVLSGHELRGFFIISHNNINLASTRDNNIGITNLTVNKVKFQNRVWSGETVISSPQQSDVPLEDNQGKLIEHYPTMFVGTPIINSEGKTIAMFTLRIDPTTKLRDIVQSGRIGKTGESYLIDSEGYLLTKSRFERELVHKKILNTGKKSTFNVKVNDPIVNFIKGNSDINIEGYFDYREEVVVGAWTWEPDLLFGIVTEIDMEEAYTPYNRTKQIFILFTTGAMLLFGICSWLFVHIHTRMQTNKKQADTLFENAGDPILIIDKQTGNILSANKLSSKLLKYDNKEFQGLNIRAIREKSTRKKVIDDLQYVNKNGSKLIKTNYCDKNGTIIPVEVSAKVVPYGNTEVILSIIRDVTERKNAEEKLQLSSRVFSDTHEGIIITDPQQRIVDVNPAFTQITGYSREDVIEKLPSILSSGKQSSTFYTQMWQSVKENGHWQGEVWNRTKQGELYAELLNISSLTNELDEVTHYVGVFSDITISKQHQDQLNLMAHYDVLTKLPNRALFIDRFNQSIAHSKRTKNQLAVCFLDLDDFKPVNDNYGHNVGDRLLIEVAGRITACIREEDTVSRQGGDEFAILLNDIKSTSQYEETLKRIHQAVALPYFIDDIQHNVTASSGVTLYPLDDGDIDTLLRHADHAMYQSKLSGKHRSQLYSPDSDQRIIQKNIHLEEIERALCNHELQLYYQPKVNMANGDVYGVEALIRWNHPEKGLIPPLDFLPFIDGTPLEIKVGEWVIHKALQQLTDWQKKNIELEVSINISSNHLLSSSFIEVLEKCFAEHSSIDAQYLQLEILESSALGDLNKINQIIETCQARLGISFALDDFGTGYSSLTHLRSLPVDIIKIDQSFVRDMLDDPSDYSIIEGVIDLTNTFNRNVIAEGVETTNHGIMLLFMGCEKAQGYAIGKPMPAMVFLQWLKDYVPNKDWLLYGNKYPTYKDNSLKIFRIISDQWKEKFRKKIVSLPEANLSWPLMNSKDCHCGNWIHQKKQEQLLEKEEFKQLEQAHNEIHIIAKEMQSQYQIGDIETAQAFLPDIELAFKKMKILSKINDPQ
jgi:diguanylate cyclase (GGDEF)-like protein/PAS domain S-box-containing protein